MLKTILLISLISGLDSFTQPSLDLNQTVSQKFDNTKLPNTSKQIIAQKPTPTQEKYPTVKVEGFLFQLRECKSTQHKVTRCDLVIYNELERRTLYLGYRTRIIDDLGNELVASEYTLGSESRRGSVYNDLPQKVSVKASIIFRGDIGDNIVLLDIGTPDFRVEFRQK